MLFLFYSDNPIISNAAPSAPKFLNAPFFGLALLEWPRTKGGALMTTDLENITKRLEKLERQNRRLKQSWIAALLLICLIVTLGLAGPIRIIEAEKFVLKDATGKTTAELSTKGAGPELRFLDYEGKLRLGVGIYAGSPNVALFDRNEKQVATFVADQTGSELWFGDGTSGKPLATLGTNPTLGKDGRPTLASFLRLRDRKGNDRIELEFSPVFEEASIDVYGARKNVIWKAP